MEAKICKQTFRMTTKQNKNWTKRALKKALKASHLALVTWFMLIKMADKDVEEKTIAEDLVVTKYKLAGEIVNRKFRK